MGLSTQSLPTARPLASSGNSYLWQASSGPLQIKFPTTVLESIRFEVSRAGNGIGHVGIGGVLLGERSGAMCTVQEWMPIDCDHARGPAFLMSHGDEARLSSLREFIGSQESPSTGQVIGWFVSHPREQLQLTREEVEIHQRRFAGALTLVVKPDQFGALEIAVHESGRAGVGAPRLMEPVFSVDPLPIVRRESGQRRRLGPAKLQPAVAKVGLPVVPPVVRAPQSRPNSWRTPVVAAALLLGAALVSAMAAHTFRAQPPISALPDASPIEMLSLHAMHRPGRLVVSWNGSAAPIRFASRVTLVLHDGKTTTRRVLSRADARTGIQFFNSTSPQVSARLVLETPNGAVFTEDTEVVNAGAAAPRASRVTPDMLPPSDGRAEKF